MIFVALFYLFILTRAKPAKSGKRINRKLKPDNTYQDKTPKSSSQSVKTTNPSKYEKYRQQNITLDAAGVADEQITPRREVIC